MRMRLIGWQVQPIVMADDGEALTPVSVNPQIIPASQWGVWKAGEDAKSLEGLRAQIEAPKPPGPPVGKHGPGKRKK